jgi:hypothetical protein
MVGRPKDVGKDVEAIIRESFDYLDGNLVFKKRVGKCQPGQIAGYCQPNGYCRVGVNGSKMLVHRVIWFLVKGSWPENIDHVNHNKHDNRIENLRGCSWSENKGNVRYGNSRGVRKKGDGRYEAYTSDDKKYLYLGVFDSFEDAARVVDEYNKGRFGPFHLDRSA